MPLLLLFIIFISCFDIIIVSVSIGTNGIKLNIKKVFLINGIISICIYISYLIRKYGLLLILDLNILKKIAFILFMLLCISKLLSFLKNKKKIIDYDLDNNNDLSFKEIFILTSSLSIDNILMSLGTDIISNYIILFIPVHYLFNTSIFYISNLYSYKILNINFNLSDLLNSFLFFFLAITNL